MEAAEEGMIQGNGSDRQRYDTVGSTRKQAAEDNQQTADGGQQTAGSRQQVKLRQPGHHLLVANDACMQPQPEQHEAAGGARQHAAMAVIE